MDQCFELLRYAISQEVEESKTKMYSYDPLKALMERLEHRLETCGWDLAGCASPELTPSTSDHPGDVKGAVDTRMRYSAMLNLILNKLSSEVKRSVKAASDPATVLSVERMTALTSALQFYIPTAVAPYIDEGVGLGVEQRCKLVKYWQPLREDNPFRRRQLLSAARSMQCLLECCPQMRHLIASKFLSDLVVLNEQLLNLEESSMKQHYEAFILQHVHRADLMGQLLRLMNPMSALHKRVALPKWFTLAVGRRLSEMTMEPNGIANLVTALTQDGELNFDNSTFVHSLAKVVAMRPQFLKEGDSRRTLYHANILKQFIALMQKHPAARKIAPWFAATVEAIAAQVPRTVAICWTDTLLHPWEVLGDQNGKMKPWSEGWTRRLDDSLRVLVLYATGLSPATTMHPVDRMKKVMVIWLSLLGSAVQAMETVTDAERRKACRPFVDDLCLLVTRTLLDPSFDSDAQQANFLVQQLMNDSIQMSVEYKFEALITELDTSADSGTEQRKLNYAFVRVHATPDAGSAPARAKAFDNVVKAIVYVLEHMDKEQCERLTIRVVSECVELSREGGGSGDEEANDDERFVAIEEHPHAVSRVDRRMRAQCLMLGLGPVLDSCSGQSEEQLCSMLGMAQVIIESLNRKVEGWGVVLDVERAVSEEESELRGVSANIVEMAVALVGAVVLSASDSEQVKSALSSVGSTMKRFCVLVEGASKQRKAQYSSAFDSALHLLDVLNCASVPINEPPQTAHPSAEGGTKLRKASVKADKLTEIMRDMEDSEEAIRGHALIELARCVRRRERSVLEAIKKRDRFIDTVMRLVADDDSYVYLTAINAMAELAFWDRNHLDSMVALFADTDGTLSALLDDTQQEMSADAKKDFLLIQRVKLAEALGKVCKALGDLAPWHFDRLVDVLLSMVMHMEDEQLRASCVCALSDLVLACRGRKLSTHLNEMLLMVEQLLGSAKEPLLRRAAMVLIRAVIVSYDTSLLEGLSSHLRDLHRHLRHLLVMDRDDGVRLLAELCLLDIKAQMDTAVRDLENSMIKRIRLA